MTETLEHTFLDRLHELIELRETGVQVVCADTTPVLFFGELGNARTVTIGINPSWHEFCSKDGKPLLSAKQRFAHRSDLVGDNASNARLAVERMRRYFQVNPYCAWFGWLEALLNGFGDSYCQGTAAHTDVMSCFATSPTWSKLPAADRKRLAASGYETLTSVLLHARDVERLIVIGKSAREALSVRANLRFDDVPTPLDALPKFRKWHVPVLCEAVWRLPDGRALPVLGLKPYLKGTPGAPLSHSELRSVAALLEDQPLRRAS